jgi:ribosomal protein S18 acetylase RimI-like enzyme
LPMVGRRCGRCGGIRGDPQRTNLGEMTPQVRPAQKSDVGDLGRTLGRAFFDDPVSVWLLPDVSARVAGLSRLFATMTRHHHLARGGVEVACDGPDIGAAALWDPPNQWRESRRAQLAQTPTFLRVFGLRTARARGMQEMMKHLHPEEPHWYLAVIGSDPSVRGRGFGQVLMRSRLERCDAEYCPAYLESSKPENVPYYERFGFTVTGEIVLPDGGPTIWPMWRDPR